MKRIAVCLSAAAAAALGLNVLAQPPEEGQDNDRPRAEGRDGDRPESDRPDGDRGEGRRGGRGEGRGFGGGFGGGFRMPPSPVMAALDADADGELSTEEINNATKALKALDKNNDGKLAGDEIRPQFGGPGGPGGGFGDPAQFVDRMIEGSDKDKDGKLSEEEMPEFMRRGFAEMDTNKDGFADKAELEEAGRRMRERFGRGPGGPGGPGGDRPRERPPTRERDGDRPAPQGDAPVSPDDL